MVRCKWWVQWLGMASDGQVDYCVGAVSEGGTRTGQLVRCFVYGSLHYMPMLYTHQLANENLHH